MAEQTKKEDQKQPGDKIAPVAERFVAQVQQLFVSEMGAALQFTDLEKTLAQHMYLKVDAQLKSLEAKRLKQNNADPKDARAFTWQHVNLPKLALDSVHRVNLGLDALIPNHIHPVPYMNGKTGLYDLDLRIGYQGKDYCRRELAVEKPIEIIYQLVHETDEFEPIFKDFKNEIDSYTFKVKNPFVRGKVIGGFGYIRYADAKKNKLVLVTQRDFQKAEAGAQTQDFWAESKYREEMQFKTVVHRVTDELPLDPRKVNAPSFAFVEAQEQDEALDRQIDANANKTVIDTTMTVVDEETGEINSGGDQPEQATPVTQATPPKEQLDPTGTDGPGY
jgi:recombination protein RecT